MRPTWSAIGLFLVISIVGSPIASGAASRIDRASTGPSDALSVARARTLRLEVSSRYVSAHGAGLEVTEASSTAVVESFTLLTQTLDETRVVPTRSGVFYAVCPVGALCPYPARRFARSPATFLPRRLALELAVRTFAETSATVVAISLPAPRFVIVVVERGDLAGEADLALFESELREGPARAPSAALRAFVERATRPRVFVVLGLEPTPSGRDSLAAVAAWPIASS